MFRICPAGSSITIQTTIMFRICPAGSSITIQTTIVFRICPAGSSITIQTTIMFRICPAGSSMWGRSRSRRISPRVCGNSSGACATASRTQCPRCECGVTWSVCWSASGCAWIVRQAAAGVVAATATWRRHRPCWRMIDSCCRLVVGRSHIGCGNCRVNRACWLMTFTSTSTWQF